MKARLANLGRNAASSAQGFARLAISGQSREFYQLAGITLFIVALGLLFVISSSSIVSIQMYDGDPFHISGRQAIFAVIGVIVMAALSVWPEAAYRRVAVGAFTFLVVLQYATSFVLGANINGNRSWIDLGPLGSFQPSEFLKLGIIVMLALVLAERAEFAFSARDYTHFAFWRVFVIAVAGVAVGKDMGTSIVIALIALMMLYMSGAPHQHMRMPIAFVTVAGAFMLTLGSSRGGRISAFLNPGDDSSSPYAWQSVHGIWAIAAGRLTGAGIGQSKLKWSWIPEVENDYIFAVIAEEGGFLLALVVIAAFAYLAVCLYRVYQRCDGTFQKLTTLGVFGWIIFQATINIQVVIGLAPVLGVPLPMISQGGSSMVSTLMAIGVVLSFERENHRRLGRPFAPTRRSVNRVGR